MGVQYVFGLFILGLMLPYITLLNLCKRDQDVRCVPGKGVREAKNISIIKGGCGLLANVVKFPVLVIALNATGKLKGAFDMR